MALSKNIDQADVFADLARRFAAARRSALCACVPESSVDEAEQDLVARALAHDAATAQRAMFDNCLHLGRGFRRFHGRVVALSELPALLPRLGLSCADGVFKRADDDAGLLLLRSGCAFRALGAGACDLYHEALHGLVLGLTDGLFHTRHASLGHGADACVDAFHPEGSALRYGTIPANVREELDRIARLLREFDSSLSVEFLGINDGALHYRVSHGPHTQLSARTQVERHVRKRYPHLSVQEVSARPVMSG
jgi:hypothetical protein